MYIITLNTTDGTCYLRVTVWTFPDRRERASEYASIDAAQAALDKARKFMPAKLYKAARIVAA